MNLTRRELLRRAAMLAATLPLANLLKQDKPLAESETVDMYRYPSDDDPVAGWFCKECKESNPLDMRHCWHCGETEVGIPVRWTCPDCGETVSWGRYCHCYNQGHEIQNSEINPFWLG